MKDEELIKELCKKDMNELQYYKGVVEALMIKFDLDLNNIINKRKK